MPRILLTQEEREYNYKKSIRIAGWKRNGIIDEDLSAVYEYMLDETHCMVCFKEYKDSLNRHLDHNHETGEIRYICCQNCNNNFLREKFHNPVHTKISKRTTSGHLNIRYNKERDKWHFTKNINKKTIEEWFDTLEEAVQWKIDNNYP